MEISIIGMSKRLFKYYKQTGYLPIELYQNLYSSDSEEFLVDYYRIYDYNYNFAFNVSVDALKNIYLGFGSDCAYDKFNEIKRYDSFDDNDSIACVSISVAEFLALNKIKIMPCSNSLLPIFDDVMLVTSEARDYIGYTNTQADMLRLHLSGENKLKSKVITNNNLICLCYYKATKHYLVVDTENTYPYLLNRQEFLEFVKKYNFSNVDFDTVDEMPHLSKKYVVLKDKFCDIPEIKYKLGTQELSILDRATKLAVTTNKNVKSFQSVALYNYYYKSNYQDLNALLELNKSGVKDFFVIIPKQYKYISLNDLIQEGKYTIIYDMSKFCDYAYTFSELDYSIVVISIANIQKVFDCIQQARDKIKYFSMVIDKLLYLNISYSDREMYMRLYDYFTFSKLPLQIINFDKRLSDNHSFYSCYNLYVKNLPTTLYSGDCFLVFEEAYYVDDMIIISDNNSYMSTYRIEDCAGLNKLRFCYFGDNKTVAYLGCNFTIEAIGLMLPFLLNFDIWVFN